MSDLEPVPRRFDVNKMIGRTDHAIASRLIVFLDGIEQDVAIGYDLDAGTVVRLRTNRKGECVPVLVNGEWKLETETVSGDVEVCWREEL